MITRENKEKVLTIASYMTVGTFTLVSISSLFLLFMVISLMDDTIRLITPNLLDWTLSHISTQLTQFAEWEKNKRTFWYDRDHPIYHQDRFHAFILTVTDYLNDYVERKK